MVGLLADYVQSDYCAAQPPHLRPNPVTARQKSVLTHGPLGIEYIVSAHRRPLLCFLFSFPHTYLIALQLAQDSNDAAQRICIAQTRGIILCLVAGSPAASGAIFVGEIFIVTVAWCNGMKKTSPSCSTCLRVHATQPSRVRTWCNELDVECCIVPCNGLSTTEDVLSGVLNAVGHRRSRFHTPCIQSLQCETHSPSCMEDANEHIPSLLLRAAVPAQLQPLRRHAASYSYTYTDTLHPLRLSIDGSQSVNVAPLSGSPSR